MRIRTFDTLGAVRELEAAGFTREQAEAAGKTMRDAAPGSRSDLATRPTSAGPRSASSS